MINKIDIIPALADCLLFKEKKKYKPSQFKDWYCSSAWRKLRAVILSQDPLCVKCLERGTHKESKVVNHIKPHKGDRKLFYDMKNLEGLCKRCHNRLSAMGL